MADHVDAIIGQLAENAVEACAFTRALEKVLTDLANAVKSASGRAQCDAYLEFDIAETKYLKALADYQRIRRLHANAVAERARAK